jgi:predicted pyridoxine 5'-phosphate oxidase superfamily flavin-nucleotide-binding protein
MIKLTDEMKELLYSALADGSTALVGTASKDGWPQISPKGSVMVYGQDTLAYWERSKRSAMDNLAENPKVVIYYNNSATRTRWRFYGTATIYDSGPIRDDVMNKTIQAELDRDPERQGVAVLVKIDKVGELSGNILQQRD